jgi:hypothetical protein
MVDTLVFMMKKWEYDKELEKQVQVLFGVRITQQPMKNCKKVGRKPTVLAVVDKE